ncbi:hypothetical protein FSP39_015467 [Pinctada imbricata]|uniref:TIR domain-containing protein n=1 Tax=Pinctada imbricata TaxID=66713 RepID=A0AA88XZ58_PINIB|nr:hypothetical protein FSP39_015467 [Pinctada imbricata]
MRNPNDISVLTIAVFLLSSGLVSSQSLMDSYPCPKECTCTQRKPGAILVDVVCNLKRLNFFSNFSVIQTTIPSILYVVCISPEEAELRNFMFKDLRSFLGISFTNCRFSYMPTDVFDGMLSLRHISVDNAKYLRIAEDIFTKNRKITHLTITNSDLETVPSLCALRSLQFINFTNNNIANFTNLGMNCANGVSLRQLKTVILSKNAFQTIDTKIGITAPNIWELDVDNCDISYIEHDVLHDLPYLGWLDLSNNSLTSLPPELLSNNDKLQVLAIGENPIEELPDDFLGWNTQLVVLGLSKTSLNDSIWESLSPLRSLRELQLADNNITRVDRTAMESLTHVEYLDLSGNEISNLNDQIFSRQDHLKTLLLNGNKIRNIEEHSFTGLSNLTKLDISRNDVSKVDNRSISILTALRHLNISHNNLSSVPNVAKLTHLTALDVGYNIIENVSEGTFGDLVSVEELNLSNNRIKEIPRHIFSIASRLERLDISNNEIEVIHQNSFRGPTNLRWLYMKNNKLKDINKILLHLPSLIHLDLSENEIATALYDGVFPTSLEFLSLAHNNISTIALYTFYKLNSIRTVDLRFNYLESIKPDALVMSPSVLTPTVIYLAGNELKCDCKLKWLRDIIDRPPVHGSLFIEDLNQLTCQAGFRIGQGTPLKEVDSQNMLCHYTQECDTRTCRCCDFDPCICKYNCPNPCECFHQKKKGADHFVVCSGKNITVPPRFPSITTDLRLDGNNLSVLRKLSFFSLISVEVIYLNDSGIQHMENGAFKGTSGLKRLFLDHNYLQEIRRDVFDWITNLTELHLENNLISFIEKGTFVNLLHLRKLYLDHNNLKEITNVIMYKEPPLRVLSLSENPWSCECDFLEKFYTFVLTHDAIIDRFSVECEEIAIPYSTYSVSFGGKWFSKEVMNIDMKYMCPHVNITLPVEENRTRERPIAQILIRSTYDHPYYVIIGISLFISFIMCIIGLIYRSYVQVYVYSKCGVRLKCNSHESEKLYDAFVSYSHKDSDFVEREIISRLEGGENEYNLCAHQRDNSPYNTSEVVDAIENSRRTIMVLSNNFIDHEWSQYDFQTSHHNALVNRQSSLIIVILHDINQKRLNKVLRLFLRISNKLRYDDPWFWDKLIYVMPENPVRKTPRDVVNLNETVIEKPPDVVPTSVGSSVDDEGYETPVSRSASRHDNEKFPSLESFSLHSVNNIYEEIGAKSTLDV